MIGTILVIGALIGGMYTLAVVGDTILGQPRRGNGQFGSKRTTVVEDAVKIGCLAALAIVIFTAL